MATTTRRGGRHDKFYRCTDPNIGRPKSQLQPKARSRILGQWLAATDTGTVTFDKDGIGYWA